MTTTTTKYDFVPDKKDKTLECVRILEGKYKGMIYQYGTASFEENNNEDNALLSFNYRIVESVEDVDPDELQEILGDILVDILDEHVEELEGKEFSVQHDEVESNPILEKQIKDEKRKIEAQRND